MLTGFFILRPFSICHFPFFICRRPEESRVSFILFNGREIYPGLHEVQQQNSGDDKWKMTPWNHSPARRPERGSPIPPSFLTVASPLLTRS
jgi:hypothetical protein